MEKTFDERAEEYWNNLTQPLADPKGLAVTAYVVGCMDQERIIKKGQAPDSIKTHFDQQKQAIKTKCLELASNKTVKVPALENNNYTMSRDLTAEEMIDYAQKLYNFITSYEKGL